MKFIIRWNTGYGDSFDVVNVDSEEDANKFAYEVWQEEVESNADYEAIEYSDSNKELYDIDDD